MLKFAPNIIKEYLLQNGLAHAALVLDALAASGAVEWQICTIPDMIKWFKLLGVDLSDQLLRKGLAQLRELKILGVQVLNAPRRGRPALAYRLPSWAAIAEILGLKLHEKENHHAVELSAFVSVRAYRAGLHRSYIMVNQNKKIDRAFLGRRLGVGGRSTYNYEQKTDIVAIPKYEKRMLSTAEILRLPERATSSKFFLLVEYERPMTEDEKNQAFSWVSIEGRKSLHPTTIDQKKLPASRYLAMRERALGRSVYVAWQVANEYKIA